MSGRENAVLIAGPTASGKSSYAMERAETIHCAGGRAVLVNADSMQVYDGLRVVTARPSHTEEARVDHHLYGFVDPARPFSTGQWLQAVSNLLAGMPAETVPIFVGGTGLYFKALTNGLSIIPEIPDEVRREVRERAQSEDMETIFADLKTKDPDFAARIEPTDRQRTLRALEVWMATGKSLSWWQDQKPPQPLVNSSKAEKIVILPARERLYERIHHRFLQMIEGGAIEEVEALLKRDLDPNVPLMKAIGVREIAAHLQGSLSLDEAIEQASRQSRRYAKRQMTWMRNQMGEDWRRLFP